MKKMTINMEFTVTDRNLHMSLSNVWELVIDREACHAAVHGIAESDMNERLN